MSYIMNIVYSQENPYNITEPISPEVILNTPPSIERVVSHYYVPSIVDASGNPLIESNDFVSIGSPFDEEGDAFESEITCATRECQNKFTFD